MKNFLKGIVLGFALILPGLSGGTAFLIMGMYKQILRDLAFFNLRPYITFAMGAGVGLLFWAFFLSHLLNEWPELVFPFLLGALWASAPLILKINKISFSPERGVYLLTGTCVGWILAVEPLATFSLGETKIFLVLFLAGLIASATMLIPGVSGSAVLLILGVYHDILLFLNSFELVPLAFFTAGCIGGLFGLARLLLLAYERYKGFFSYFTAGLILGSGRTLFPAQLNLSAIIAILTGAVLITLWSRKNLKRDQIQTEEREVTGMPTI